MTTPEPPDELGPVANQLPRANETPVAPSIASSTPGVALAGARVPGAPTLPDWDPVALTSLLGQMANEMFRAPPVLPTSDDVASPGAPAAALSSPGVSPMSSPAALGMPSAALESASAGYAPKAPSGYAPASPSYASPSSQSYASPSPSVSSPSTSSGYSSSPSTSGYSSSPSTSGYSSSPSTSSRPASASRSMPSSGSSPAMSTVLPDTSVSPTPPSPTVMSTTVPVSYPSTSAAPSPGGVPQRPPHVPGAPSPAYPPPPVSPSTPGYGAPAAPAQLSTPPAHTPPSGVPTHVPVGSAKSPVAGAAQPVSPPSSPFDAPLDWSVLTAVADPYEHRDLPLALLDFAEPSATPSTAAPSSAPGAPTASPGSPGASAPASRFELPTYQPVATHESSIRPLGNKPFDPYAIKREFPILDEPVRGKRLVWLDNAATTQKPRAVIDRLSYFYEHENSNIHRAAHTLAARATDAYESARESVRRFIHAPSTKEIVFVRGTTEGINFIAKSWGARNVRAGDEIVISWLEHHANIVPWQQLCEVTGARLKVAPVDNTGQVILEAYERLLGPKTKLVSFTQVSNALGTVTPAREMIEMAHRHGAVVVLDGAQSVSHMPVDVMTLGCDFFVFSGHKVFGPTGIGAVFGRTELLEAMPPWQGGGNMIQDVTFEKTVYQGAPARFEAGTGNIADAVGLGAALDWLAKIGVENVGRYEHELLEYGTALLREVPGLTLVGTAPGKAGVMSFVLDGHNTTDVGGLLDQEGIAVRSGHHCAQPILRRFGYEATVRASLAPYNTFEDLEVLAAALHRLQAGHVSR